MKLVAFNIGRIMNFIKARLNKDNLTNLLFFLGMQLGLGLSSLCLEISALLAGIFFWMTVIFVPLIVRDFSGVAFVGNKTFLNSKGESLVAKYPKHLGSVIVLTLLLAAFCSYSDDNINTAVLRLVLFLIPTLYFIYKNCPISILFYKTGRDKEITGITYITNSVHRHAEHSLSYEMRFNPRYNYLGSNIYHHHRKH